jgi:nitroimidazol reductase NimA-like FMN-containing flavoprotein (pyridoxamine 5'-phosphate oxidase superfamily)
MTEAWIETLSEEHCIELLRAEVVGRIAFSEGEYPVVFPVNYRIVDTLAGPLLALRTATGGPIDRAPATVALEIDGIDHSHGRGWSVLVRGVLRHLDSTVAVVRESFDSLPWIGVDRDTWLAIEPVTITGRRLQSATLEWAFHASAYL